MRKETLLLAGTVSTVLPPAVLVAHYWTIGNIEYAITFLVPLIGASLLSVWMWINHALRGNNTAGGSKNARQIPRDEAPENGVGRDNSKNEP